MAELRKIAPGEIGENAVSLISEKWMLVTSSDPDGDLVCGRDYNTMTASWGGLGFIWGKPVAFVFVRPSRHTFGFIERNPRLTLTFFPEEYRKALAYCGKYSGRDYDKAKECGITPVYDKTADGRAVWFSEADIVLKTKKLYADFFRPEGILSPVPAEIYADGSYHKMYVCEIEEALVR